MHKMLVVAVFLVLGGAAAQAAGTPDRAKLSYDENATINRACAAALKQGVGSFNGCVQRQLTALRDHPTPDRSGLSPAQNRDIEENCGYLRRESIGSYNDCVRKAISTLHKAAAKKNEVGTN